MSSCVLCWCMSVYIYVKAVWYRCMLGACTHEWRESLILEILQWLTFGISSDVIELWVYLRVPKVCCDMRQGQEVETSSSSTSCHSKPPGSYGEKVVTQRRGGTGSPAQYASPAGFVSAAYFTCLLGQRLHRDHCQANLSNKLQLIINAAPGKESGRSPAAGWWQVHQPPPKSEGQDGFQDTFVPPQETLPRCGISLLLNLQPKGRVARNEAKTKNRLTPAQVSWELWINSSFGELLAFQEE